jgi:hypothetical protein
MLPPPTLHVPLFVITNVAVFAVTVRFVRVVALSAVPALEQVIVEDPIVNVRVPDPVKLKMPAVMFFEFVLNVPAVNVSVALVIVTLSDNRYEEPAPTNDMFGIVLPFVVTVCCVEDVDTNRIRPVPDRMMNAVASIVNAMLLVPGVVVPISTCDVVLSNTSVPVPVIDNERQATV